MYDAVLIDIDTQNDFLDPKGALLVPGSDAIIGNIQRLIAFGKENGLPIISSVDAHAPDDPEFQRFPPHCVCDTWGQEKFSGTVIDSAATVPMTAGDIDIVATLETHRQIILEKDTFNVFDNPAAVEILARIKAQRLVVFGVATDYCVKATVERLLDMDKANIVLVTDAIAGIDKEHSKQLLETFEERGVMTATTLDILGK